MKRMEMPYTDDDSLKCMDDFENKYNIGNPKEYIEWLDDYHRALVAAENEIESLNLLLLLLK